MHLARIPDLVRPHLGDLLWRMPADDRVVYLTFDDGPTPGVTPWVLDLLAQAEAKATFFCVGRDALQRPEMVARIRSEGHAIGNHTWAHEDGWRTPDRTYYRSVLQGHAAVGSPLFRPPYGHVTPKQARVLSRRYTVVMWDVLSGDFDPSRSGEECVRTVLKNVRPGSIIVFHDSVKAEPRVRYALPRVLDKLAKQGYEFNALPEKKR